MEILFDAERHIYTVNGEQIPSVTSILSDVYGDKPYWNAENARIGTLLHLYCANECLGIQDHAIVHKNAYSRFMGFVKFLKETDFEVIETEKRGICEGHMFAGTIDIVAKQKDEVVLIDIKSNFTNRAFLQLGAYSMIEKCVKAYILELTTAQGYRLIPLNIFGSWEISMNYWRNAFLSTYSVYKLKHKYNL